MMRARAVRRLDTKRYTSRQLMHYSFLLGPVETDEDGSSVSSANSDTLSDDLEDEEDLERALAAYRPEDETLKDMVSPTTRRRIAETWSTSTSWAFWGGKAAGNAVWIATTSALLVGLPLAMAIENETMMVQQEKEMLGQQQGAQQVIGRRSDCAAM